MHTIIEDCPDLFHRGQLLAKKGEKVEIITIMDQVVLVRNNKGETFAIAKSKIKDQQVSPSL